MGRLGTGGMGMEQKSVAEKSGKEHKEMEMNGENDMRWGK